MRAQKQNFSPQTKSAQTISLLSDFDLDLVSSFSLDKENFEDDIQKRTPFQYKSAFKKRQPKTKAVWIFQDEEKLIELHKSFGNKWTDLAKFFPMMSENSIKNRFYSRLRKSIRKLNKTMMEMKIREYNKFKLNIIFQLSNISETKLLEKDRVAPQIFQFYKEFLYDLIKFSSQKPDFDGQGKNPYQTKQEIEELALPLVALQNLFRLVRGERTAKGKKKNIAYLRQFTFRLSLQSPVFMIITKENIYLQNTPEIINLEVGEPFVSNKTVVKRSSIVTKSSVEQIELFGKSSSQSHHGKQSQIDEEIEFLGKLVTDNIPMEEDQREMKTESQLWKDYMGCEMKEIDFFGGDCQDRDNLNQFTIDSLRDIELSDEEVNF